jgi:hypothetical protein
MAPGATGASSRDSSCSVGEKAGYVRRARDPHDRRKVMVQLLPNEQMDALLAAAFGPFADDMTKI